MRNPPTICDMRLGSFSNAIENASGDDRPGDGDRRGDDGRGNTRRGVPVAMDVEAEDVATPAIPRAARVDFIGTIPSPEFPFTGPSYGRSKKMEVVVSVEWCPRDGGNPTGARTHAHYMGLSQGENVRHIPQFLLEGYLEGSTPVVNTHAPPTTGGGDGKSRGCCGGGANFWSGIRLFSDNPSLGLWLHHTKGRSMGKHVDDGEDLDLRSPVEDEWSILAEVGFRQKPPLFFQAKVGTLGGGCQEGIVGKNDSWSK